MVKKLQNCQKFEKLLPNRIQKLLAEFLGILGQQKQLETLGLLAHMRDLRSDGTKRTVHFDVLSNVMFRLQKADKHATNLHKLNFCTKSLTFSCLICALSLHFAQTLLRKANPARGCWNLMKLL